MDKAFDKVPHKRLLYKLDYYGIKNNTLLWIQDFLSLRSQTVLLAKSLWHVYSFNCKNGCFILSPATEHAIGT